MIETLQTRFFIPVVTSSAMLLLSACGGHGSGATTASAPPVVSISASPAAVASGIDSGGSSVLTWSSNNATYCTASGAWSGLQKTSGTQSTGPLTSSAAYSLTCTGVGGTSAVVTVAVTIGTMPTATLYANPLLIAGGGTSTLTWSSTNATSCTASGGASRWPGPKPASGSQVTSALPADTTFSLICSGAGGTSTPASATVTLVPLPTAFLTANPTSIVSGASSVLNWSSTNATSCAASGPAGWAGPKPMSGTQSTGPLTANTPYSITCTGIGGTSTAATATLTIATGTIVVVPKAAGITLFQQQQFTATVPGGGTPVWSVDTIAGGNATVGTIDSTGLYTPGSAAGLRTILASSGSASGTATLGVTDLSGVYTYHNDLSRDGANLQEYALTTSNVASGKFGKLASCVVDGALYGQPLWVANLTVNGAKHNVVYVATQHDGLFAFDADASPCLLLWKANLIDVAHGGALGETSVPNVLVGGGSGDIAPEIGVTSTPVIDPVSGTLFVLTKSVDAGQTTYYHRLHAIDLATGLEKTGSPIQISATYQGPGSSTLTFASRQQGQRPALALVNGTIYVAFGSHNDTAPYYGWMMGYTFNGTNFAQSAVFNVAPNADFNIVFPSGVNAGAGGIWMCGNGPVADANGNLYVLTGNGPFDANMTSAPNNDYSDSLLQLNGVLNGVLKVQGYFTPPDQAAQYANDFDFGSGGGALIANLPIGSPAQHLVIGGGKSGFLYVLNGDKNPDGSSKLGGYYAQGTDPSFDPLAIQVISSGPSIFGSGAFWNNSFYIVSAGIRGGVTQPYLSAYSLTPSSPTPFSSTPVALSANTYVPQGGTPSVSAAANLNGIVWALDNVNFCTADSTGCGPAVLYAYDAAYVGPLWQPLWHSGKLSTDPDAAGIAVKFTVPTIANGKVYVGTRGNNNGLPTTPTPEVPGELDIYGLMP